MTDFVTPSTELDAVNTCLDVIGEPPVNTLENTSNINVVRARKMLIEISRKVLTKGWHFNTDVGFTMNPSIDTGEITVPPNVVRIDACDKSKDIVVRQGKLYDRENHTFQFSSNIKVDMTILLEFEDLPEAFRYYITIRSARNFQKRELGSQLLDAFTAEEEMDAWVTVLHEEDDASDANMLAGSIDAQRISSYYRRT